MQQIIQNDGWRCLTRPSRPSPLQILQQWLCWRIDYPIVKFSSSHPAIGPTWTKATSVATTSSATTYPASTSTASRSPDHHAYYHVQSSSCLTAHWASDCNFWELSHWDVARSTTTTCRRGTPSLYWGLWLRTKSATNDTPNRSRIRSKFTCCW